MSTRPDTAAAQDMAEELEADLALYPDERAQILIEAAHAWQQAGKHDRAIALLTEAIALGGEDGASARVELAEVHFDLGDAEQAHTQLDGLRHQRPSSPTPYHLAAELLEERGELQQALTWFNMAVSRLTEEEMTQRDTKVGLFSRAADLLAGRRRALQALGLPSDEWDHSAQAHTEHAEEHLKDISGALEPPD